MSLPPLEELKRLQASLEHQRLTLGADPRTIFTVEDTQLEPEIGAEVARCKAERLAYAFTLAPELLAEVIRLREALEKQLNGGSLMIALTEMIPDQTEAQKAATILVNAFQEDLTRILEGDKP